MEHDTVGGACGDGAERPRQASCARHARAWIERSRSSPTDFDISSISRSCWLRSERRVSPSASASTPPSPVAALGDACEAPGPSMALRASLTARAVALAASERAASGTFGVDGGPLAPARLSWLRSACCMRSFSRRRVESSALTCERVRFALHCACASASALPDPESSLPSSSSSASRSILRRNSPSTSAGHVRSSARACHWRSSTVR